MKNNIRYVYLRHQYYVQGYNSSLSTLSEAHGGKTNLTEHTPAKRNTFSSNPVFVYLINNLLTVILMSCSYRIWCQYDMNGKDHKFCIPMPALGTPFISTNLLVSTNGYLRIS